MDTNKIQNAIAQIWGDDSHQISFLATPDGKIYAECEFTMGRRQLTDSNYRDVLNDMFYDYCVVFYDYCIDFEEDADWDVYGEEEFA